MKKKYIYQIRNKINGKCYIGQSVNPQRRFLEHTRKSSNSNLKVIRSVQKYGRENFELNILYYGEDYNEKERYYIQFFDSIKNGYNIAPGGNEPPLHCGETHQNAKLKLSQVHEIQKMLMEQYSLSEVSEAFPLVSSSQIGRINKGTQWYDENLRYPLTHNFRVLQKDKVEAIINEIKKNDKTLREIGKLFGVCKSTVVSINQGYNSTARKIEKAFPIRNEEEDLRNKTSIEKVREIQELLLHTNLTTKEISQRTSITTAVINHINRGLYHIDKNLQYPLRKNKTL